MKITNKKFSYLLLGLIILTQGGFLFSPNSAIAEASYTPGMECYNANGWTASKVIYNVSQWYQLNPQVILATLQKEQSLITTSTINQYGLDWAMGYGVPDSGNRDYSKQGFAKQVDWGSWQLKWNMNKANSADTTDRSKVAPYVTGSTINIDGVNTALTNGSTASLYRYTPHFHGNQNFRDILNLWFDEPDVVWDSTHITEDANFANTTTMTEQQIQDFLVAKGSYLASYTVSGNVVVGADSYRCPVPAITTVYRFYKSDGTHFYTASETEKANVIAKWPKIYKYEGVAYVLNQNDQNVSPLYRFYDKSNGTHFYTASEAEKNNITQKWGYRYQLEGVAYNVSLSGGTPVYRFANVDGTHFYTASESEKNNIIARWPKIYKLEGVAFYLGN